MISTINVMPLRLLRQHNDWYVGQCDSKNEKVWSQWHDSFSDWLPNLRHRASATLWIFPQRKRCSCISFATDRRRRSVAKLMHESIVFCSTRLCVGKQVYQIQWNNAPLRRSRSFKFTDLVPIESSYTMIHDFLLVINTITYLNILLRFQLLWLIIGQILASESRVPHFNALAGGDPLPISP